MMPKKRFSFNSAYAQLILVVFVPITILAVVGAYIVETETTKAIKSEQRTLATATLIRYEPVVKELLPLMLEQKKVVNNQDANANQDSIQNAGSNQKVINQEAVDNRPQNQWVASDLDITGRLSELDNVQNSIRLLLSSMNNNQHIQRIAVVNEMGDVVAASDAYTDDFLTGTSAIDSLKGRQLLQQGVPTPIGTAYGHLLGQYDAHQYWLIVDMDNEPLAIARLQVWIGLISIGLLTLLVLLLSLNIFAKRWIAPIYDLRLHLQHISPENMYRPVNTDSSGELNLLQQDLVKTLRRLYGDFQELKDHANQTEEDLRDAFDEMEMQNILIREARDQAVSSSQAKSAFLANISHELRTPLNSIDGFSNLLARHGDLSAEQNLYVQTIRKSSAHLLALINDVLDFSKIEAGKLVLDRHEFNLYAVIYDVMDMLSPLAAEKDLRMAVLYYNDVPNTIIGDALRVKQVLTNLVGNAIKFTDVGEVVVRVGIDDVEEDTANSTIETTTTDGGMIHIAVQDTGHGISEAAKSQLFRSFSQADPSITRQYGGTGLGLVISKQLTRLMGGKIGFYNNAQEDVLESMTLPQTSVTESASDSLVPSKITPKSGATFWFSIPAHVDIDALSALEFGVGPYHGEASEVISLPELRPFASTKDSRGYHEKSFEILVWINHTSSLQVFMAAVRPLDVTVTIAKSLAGALERLKERGNAWDWVLIDGGDSDSQEDRAALLKQIRLHYQGKLAIYGYQVALDATLLERYKAAGLYQPLDKRQLYGLLDSKNNHVTKIVAPQTWQGVRVLAVDDHLPNLLVLDALLSELSIEVITASSGYDAIDIISQQLSGRVQNANDNDSSLSHENNNYDNNNPNTSNHNTKRDNAHNENDKIDLVFMDVQMPRMSGDEAVRQIRQFESNIKNSSRIPIIALTAQALSDEKDALIEAGFDDYVGKPISRPQLLQILQRWLGKGGIAPTSSLTTHLSIDKKATDVANAYGSDTIHGSHAIDLNFDDNGQGQANVDGKPNSSIDTDSDNNQTDIVNWKDALIRSANKVDLAKQLLSMMQEATTNDIEELQVAWQVHDREQLAQIAHRILGASRYTGVPQIRQASREFEDKCLLNVKHTSPIQFKKIEKPYIDLIESLKNLQAVDLDAEIERQINQNKNNSSTLSENDMTWKMI